jgi:mannitol-1-/sugar-/sorbitol-6-/2-deoxyglucose-6-phosphatase
MIKAVIFDMDGLLIDSEPLWLRAVTKAYKSVGINITKELHNEMRGRRTNENVAHMYRRFKWQGVTPEQMEDLIIDDLVVMVKAEGALMPGVHNALQICKKAGLPVAIASSSMKRVIDAVVDTLEIREHFGHIYSAEYEQYGKPHPGVFLKVADHFGVIPADCLVFEDSPPGVIAAKSAQMKCIAVPAKDNKDHAVIKIADLVIDSLEDFDEKMLAAL